MREVVVVSPEMTAFVGHGPIGSAPLPQDPAVLAFSGFGSSESPVVTLTGQLDRAAAEAALVFAVARAACQRLFPNGPTQPGAWYMTAALRELALNILAVDGSAETVETLRLARSIELLCQVHAAYAQGELLAVEGPCSVNELDRARIAVARRFIDADWSDKLTISELARRSGLNRDKLVRGFRELYGRTIADVLSERRLVAAKQMLLASDLPVASVGYHCGYLNNASFSRAFSRRFGVPPSALRRVGVAA